MKLLAVMLLSLATCLNGWAAFAYEHESDSLHESCCEAESMSCCASSCGDSEASHEEHAEDSQCQSQCATCHAQSHTVSALANPGDSHLPAPLVATFACNGQKGLKATSLPPATPPPKRSV